jgi:hypothetical protein
MWTDLEMNLEHVRTTIGSPVETSVADPTRNSGRRTTSRQIAVISIIDGRAVWIGEVTEKVERRPRSEGVRDTSIIKTIGGPEGAWKTEEIRETGIVGRVVRM